MNIAHGSVFDVFIGLVLCYLLLGLVGSALQEAVAGWLNWRGKELRKGLQGLLAHAAAAQAAPDAPAAGNPLFEKVFRHGLVAPDAAHRLPTYVPAANFALALVDSLREGGTADTTLAQVEAGLNQLPAGPARQALLALLMQAKGDLGAFQKSVEVWFDNAMDRVSGVYKRLVHNFMLVFGVLVAVGANVDTLGVAHALWENPAAAAQVTAVARQVAGPADAPASMPAPGVGEAARQLAELPVPLGWNHMPGRDDLSWSHLLGWLITALAVSLGAPFWFDTLQRFLNMRTAGPVPAKSEPQG